MKVKKLYKAPVARAIEAESEPLMDLSAADVTGGGTNPVDVDNDPTGGEGGAKKNHGAHSVWD